jgi:gliding motility-associated-like protein
LVCPEPFFVLNPGIFSTYLWQDNSTGSTFTVADTGTYYVQVSSAGGCLAYDTIHVQALAVALNLGNDTTLCANATLVLSTPGNFANIVWQDNSTGATFTISDSGLYYATITNSAGCMASDTIHVSLDPLPPVSLPASDSLCDRSVTIAVSGAFSSYNWNTGATGPTITVSIAGNYAVTVSDENGCTSADTTEVVPCDDRGHECDNQFILPNAFTPNGDGINDVFYAIRRPSSNTSHFFQMDIYNRWGEQVFETYNENSGWDGKFKGQEVGPEVLIYAVKFVCENESILKRGSVTLLR